MVDCDHAPPTPVKKVPPIACMGACIATALRRSHGSRAAVCPADGRTHLGDFIDAYNFARPLKKLSGLIPYEYITKICTSEPDWFIVDPIYQMLD